MLYQPRSQSSPEEDWKNEYILRDPASQRLRVEILRKTGIADMLLFQCVKFSLYVISLLINSLRCYESAMKRWNHLPKRWKRTRPSKLVGNINWVRALTARSFSLGFCRAGQSKAPLYRLRACGRWVRAAFFPVLVKNWGRKIRGLNKPISTIKR